MKTMERFRWKDGPIKNVSAEDGEWTEITIIDLLNPQRRVGVLIGDTENHREAPRFAVQLRKLLNREMGA